MTFNYFQEIRDVEPAEPELEGGGTSWWHVCSECRGLIDAYDNYCRHCGRKIKKRTACDGCAHKGSKDCSLGKPGSENAYCPNGKLQG